MCRNWFCIAALFLLISNAYADTCIPVKRVSFDDFMHQSLSVSIPLTLLVPVEYEFADIESPVSYSYWMKPEGAKIARETKDLPKATGYMYGKLSLGVGYDIASDTFPGMENFKAKSEAQGFVDVSVSQQKINGHSTLFTQLSLKSNGRKVYGMYVAMNLSTNTIYLSYVPPTDAPNQNECFWEALKASLVSPSSAKN